VATLVASPSEYLRKALGPGARVLLVNPPVQEKRYHWIRWNQPLELLRLSTWLKETVGTADVQFFDFMLPSEQGDVPRHKVKETWTGPGAHSLWHFGQPFEKFDKHLDGLLKRRWVPDLILVSSLTSYWHVAIEKLLLRICNVLGPTHRSRTTVALYGAYPRFEREHAEGQRDADVAFTAPVDVTAYMPDFSLYFEQHRRAPLFFGLDIEAKDAPDHLAACLDLQTRHDRLRGLARPQTILVAFLNEDICGPKSRLKELASHSARYEGRVRIEAITGAEPRSMGLEHLEMLTALGTKAFFVEYATTVDGRLDEAAYVPLRQFLDRDRGRRRAGGDYELDTRDAVTAFVNVGLPSDDIEKIVRNTLVLNQYFQAIILKPFGYSPDIDTAPADMRRGRWPLPAHSSPQWFPYVDRGSPLSLADYDNLMRWQGIVNKRVKNFTFDFLATGSIPRLVRETLVDESWKRARGAKA
jgi:hypothetical protein